MENSLDIVRHVVEALAKETESFEKEYKENGRTRRNKFSCLQIGSFYLNNTRYFLNKMLRQISVAPNKIHISKAAQEKWDKYIMNENIKEYGANDKIRIKDDCCLPMFKASAKIPEDTLLRKGQSIQFNNLFHDEHIVPICVVEDNLLQLYKDNQLTDENIEKELGKIHICKITKEEDKKIMEVLKSKGMKDSDRTKGWTKIRDQIYKEAGVELLS